MEQGHVQHGQVTFGILNLAVDFLESLDVGLHELGIEDTARSTVYDARIHLFSGRLTTLRRREPHVTEFQLRERADHTWVASPPGACRVVADPR